MNREESQGVRRRPAQLTRRGLLAASAGAVATTAAAGSARAAIDPHNRVPFATWDPVSGASTTQITPVRLIMHIADSSSTDIYGPGTISGTYAHFYNRRSLGPLQHQKMNLLAPANVDANANSISVEHQGTEGQSMTDHQVDVLGHIFAWLVWYWGVPNRIATVGDTRGLAWHRLGVDGNFPAYDKDDLTTWCRRDTGKVWSNVPGKTCPTNPYIRRIPDVFAKAQWYLDVWRGEPW
jgi:hypothetical protein